jgi:hypothetical protein
MLCGSVKAPWHLLLFSFFGQDIVLMSILILLEIEMNGILSRKGWVVIPAVLREKYELKPGTKIQ